MNKRNQRILIRNLGLLLAFVCICAFLARFIHQGETLADYQKSSEGISSSSEKTSTSTQDEASDSPKQEEASDSPNQEEASGSPNQEEAPGSLNQEGASVSPDQEETSALPNQEEDAPMPDRILYKNGFYYESLNDNIKNRITGISYPADDADAQIHYDDLRYVSVLYYNFNDVEKSGELICNKEIAQDLVEIFYELYENHYQIEKIHLVDEYNGDDELSMKDNNTSCFNYRMIEGKNKLSNHSYGLAIDLNPFFNPYVTYPANGSIHVLPEGSEYYADRNKEFAYKITRDDLAYTLFTEHGFTWGGNWNSSKDYQHFEKKL